MLHPPHTVRSRGYLPHWESAGATYSITFRLADSLPQSILQAYHREREALLETATQMQRPPSPHEQARLDELFSDRIEKFLDQGAGECVLRDPRVGQLVFDAIRHFHGTRYTLHTWCVMPNHVHVLFCPQNSHTLRDILHSWKSFTGHGAGRILGRPGTIWMPEYFDHLIRDADDFLHAHRYILNNPRKAGLQDWPWVATLLPDDSGRDARVT